MYLEVQILPLDPGGDGGQGVSSLHRRDAYRRLQIEFEYANRQLETAYEELHSTNEELETTNEELQSTVEELETTNEELQSTNEELETMNEELQSMNDELHASNEELQRRTVEVGEVNAFMESVLAGLRAGRDRGRRGAARARLEPPGRGPLGGAPRGGRRAAAARPRHRAPARAAASAGARGARVRATGASRRRPSPTARYRTARHPTARYRRATPPDGQVPDGQVPDGQAGDGVTPAPPAEVLTARPEPPRAFDPGAGDGDPVARGRRRRGGSDHRDGAGDRDTRAPVVVCRVRRRVAVTPRTRSGDGC